MSKTLIAAASLALVGCAGTRAEQALSTLELAAPANTVAAPLELAAAEAQEPTPISTLGQAANGHDEDHDWAQRLVDPVTAPFLFETPVIHSSVQPVFMRHEFPGASILGGGNLRGYALQLRLAVTDRLAFIAIKDGRIDFNPGAFPDDTGYTDIGGGFKYMIHEDVDAGEIVTVGLTYENTTGDGSVLQGNGDGGWRPFVSAGWDDGDTNAIATVGAYLPVDGNAESQILDYHLQFSWELNDVFVPLVEINGLHYMNGGRTTPGDQEGVDYANLGTVGVENNDIITGAVGFRWRFDDNIDFGFAYEDTLTAREDIFGNRVTADMIWRF